MENGFDVKDVLRFQIRRVCTNLFKNYLVLLEDLGVEHDEALRKLYDALPEEYKKYVTLADYYSEVKAETLRGKILGYGNDAIRELEGQLENFDVKIKTVKRKE